MQTGSSFAKKLSAYLAARDIKQAHFAREIGVDPSVVNRWISGGTVPRGANLARLLAVTSPLITIDDVYEVKPAPAADPAPAPAAAPSTSGAA